MEKDGYLDLSKATVPADIKKRLWRIVEKNSQSGYIEYQLKASENFWSERSSGTNFYYCTIHVFDNGIVNVIQ